MLQLEDIVVVFVDVIHTFQLGQEEKDVLFLKILFNFVKVVLMTRLNELFMSTSQLSLLYCLAAKSGVINKN